MSIDALTETSDIDPELQTRIAAFVRTVPDYEEVCDRVPHTPLPPHVANFLTISPFTVILIYRLTKRPDLLEWIIGSAPEKATQILAYLTSNIQLDLQMLNTASPDAHWFIPTDSFWDGCTVEFIEAMMARAQVESSSQPAPTTAPLSSDLGDPWFLAFMAKVAFRTLVCSERRMTSANAEEDFSALVLPVCEFTWADDTELSRRVKAFSERAPDYYMAINSCSWRVPGYVQAYLRASLNAPEVAYYLVHHKQIYDAIAATQPIGAVAKLLSLERELAGCRGLMKPGTLYSTPLLLAPTPEEFAAAQRLLHLVAWDSEVGTAN